MARTPDVIYDRPRFKEEPTPDLTMLGSGQLARLTILEARRLERSGRIRPMVIGVVGGSVNDSAGQVADVFYPGDINLAADLRYPVLRSKFIGLDTEHTNSAFLQQYPDKALFPATFLPLTQNKKRQHEFLSQNSDLPMPRWNPKIDSLADLQLAVVQFDGRGVLQTGTQAYDGRR